MQSLQEIAINYITHLVIINQIPISELQLLPYWLRHQLIYKIDSHFLERWRNRMFSSFYLINTKRWHNIIEHHVLDNIPLGTKYTVFYTIEYKNGSFEQVNKGSHYIPYIEHYILKINYLVT